MVGGIGGSAQSPTESLRGQELDILSPSEHSIDTAYAQASNICTK